MILDDFERDEENDFLDEIDIPKDAANYMIEAQVNEQDKITVVDIISFPEYLKHIDDDIYLPDLELLKSIDFNNFK
ncbi:hypothetical protein [Enterococcus sp. AZ109]|uniref:hypothetical protein n=1 Tax=Enterococcus sp. AZ109 TaxID=2774634 RepID=UPI003F28B4E7